MGRETFLAEYTRQLQRAHDEHPEEYRLLPGATVESVAARMTDGLARGSANKDGRAIRATCKALGIPYTYAGLRAYLSGQ